jgi:hypothetical protein
MSQHRREVRPRYGRIAVLATSSTVTVVAGLAGIGVLAPSSVQADLARPASYSGGGGGPTAGTGTPSTGPSTGAPVDPSTTASVEPDLVGRPSASSSVTPPATQLSAAAAATAVPASSGSGRRIVFSESLQRVWLVAADGSVQRTYLVSGSVTDNLQPGTYAVYSRSRWAVGVDDSGTMQYFVRFTQGPTGAAIGFHTIPTSHGVPLQTRAQLGTPESHGCIRQATPDAVALWQFAPVGTKVVVV